VAAFFYFGAEGLEIVYLAVESDPHIARFVRERLMPGRAEVDDGQPRVAQPYAAVDPYTCIIRPTMANRLHHPIQAGWINRGTVEMNDAANAAHVFGQPTV
jgi:hypothetical protein